MYAACMKGMKHEKTYSHEYKFCRLQLSLNQFYFVGLHYSKHGNRISPDCFEI